MAPDLILCIPNLETSSTKGSMSFLKSYLSVFTETLLLEWKYSRDLPLTIRRTSRYSESLDCGKSLINFWVMATGQGDFADLARDRKYDLLGISHFCA